MIRINLNRSRVQGAAEENVDFNLNEGAVDHNLNPRDVLVRLLVVFLGVIVLMLYERQNMDELHAQLAKVQAEDNQLKQQVEEKNAEILKLKDIEPQAMGLNEKLKALRDYSKQRIEELQSMDFMQSIIPERVWLNAVHYDNHRYRFTGNAVETTDLTDFVNKLENSAYFKDVIVIEDKEKIEQNAKIRDFAFTAREQAVN